jgi:isopentenyldiphosphate isomerase
MVFTIQLEVAERLAARADTKDYGLLTLLVAPFYKVEIARRIPTSVFWPAPEVKSATVVLTRHAGFPFPTLDEEARFGRIVRRAFQQRRKTLGAVFGDELPDPALRPRRPAELDLEAWARATAISFADRTDPEADPSDEIFEIVDKDDRVVGRVPRRRVHAEHLLHRAVHVFVKNSQGEILLQRRSPLKDMAPNTWDSAAAGHLAVGESYDACARREIVEELGTSVPLTPVRKYDACEALGWEFIHLYEARAEGPFRFPPAEISELRWWEPSAVDTAIEKKSADFAASFRHLWIRFRSAQVAA